MKKLFILFFSIGLLFSCEEEEPLTTNGLEADRQNALVDAINRGENVNNNNQLLNEEFTATVNGNDVDYSIISYIEGVGASFGGSNTSPPSGISFAILSIDTGTYALGGLSATSAYSEGPNAAYEGINGELVIDSLTKSFMIGTFSFDAKRIVGGSDTVKITNGSFKINR